MIIDHLIFLGALKHALLAIFNLADELIENGTVLRLLHGQLQRKSSSIIYCTHYPLTEVLDFQTS